MNDESEPNPDETEDGSLISDEAFDRGLAMAFRSGIFQTQEQAPAGATLNFGPFGDPYDRDVAGATAIGRYEIGSELGRGGVGAVFSARDLDLRRDLALKVLLDGHRGNEQMKRRFVEEAQISGQLQHPGIVPVHEMGTLEDGRVFFAMKLIRGRTLAELLAERPDPNHDRQHFLGIFERVCQTVAYAHARGVIHRDLKPGNIMVGSYGEVQVVDWGLAKVLASSDDPTAPAGSAGSAGSTSPDESDIETLRDDLSAAVSVPGSVMGTPSYMSPEQARGEIDRLDERTDVFGLGAILCEIIAGRPPYDGATSIEVREQAARGEITAALRRIDECGANPEVCNLARACLSRTVEDRPRDARAVADSIGQFLESLEERARASELEAAEARGKALEERRARRLTVIAAALGGLILLGIGGFWIDRERRRSNAEADIREGLSKARTLMAAEVRATPDGRPNSDPRVKDLQRGLDFIAGARALIDTHSVRPELQSEAVELSETLERDLARRQLQHRLEAIRASHGDDPNWADSEPAYAECLRDLGVDLDDLSDESVVSKLAATEASSAIAVALDDWARFRRRVEPDSNRWRHLLQIAIGLDPHEQRRHLRRAFMDEDDAWFRRRALASDLPLDSASTAVLLGATLLEIDEPTLARAVFRRAAIQFPDDYWVHHGAGIAELKTEPPHRVAALAHLRTALSIRPASAHSWMEVGAQLAKLGETGPAIDHYLRALEFAPERGDIRIFLARLYREAEQFEAATQLYREATESRWAMTAWAELGRMLRKNGDVEAAREALRTAVDLQATRDDRGATYWPTGELALLRAAEGQPDAGVALLRAAIAEHPTATLYNDLGVIEQKRDANEAAAAAFREAMRLDATFAAPRENLAYVLEKTGEYGEARTLYVEALELNPRSIKGWIHYTMMLLFLEDPEWSEAFERACALGAKDPQLRVPLFKRLYSMGGRQHGKGRTREALTFFRPASRLMPKELDITTSMLLNFRYRFALSLQRAGAFDEAISVYRQLASPEAGAELRAFALVHAGQCAEALGRFTDALAWFEDGTAIYRTLKDSKTTPRAERWLRVARLTCELEPRWTAFAENTERASTAEECLALARLSRAHGRFGVAADFYLRSLALEDTNTETRSRRLRRYGAAAACVQASVDASRHGDRSASEWRDRARMVLDEILDYWSSQDEESPLRRIELGFWLDDPDLTPVREPAALAELDAGERVEWMALWTRLATTLR